jgi:hypothetical protein
MRTQNVGMLLLEDGDALGGFRGFAECGIPRNLFGRLIVAEPFDEKGSQFTSDQGVGHLQNAGTVPEFFLFAIGGTAPGASFLVLGLGELCAFAVNLGRLWTARFEGIAGVGSPGC